MTFIRDSGGCESATTGNNAVAASSEQLEAGSEYADYNEGRSRKKPKQLSTVTAAPAVRSAATGMTRDECKQHFENKMAGIRDAMRARLSANQQNKLREDYRALKLEKRNC